MKKIKHFKNLMLLIALLILSFATNAQQSARELTKESEKLYETQQFDYAVNSAIKALMIKPDFNRAIEALQQALPAAIRTNENKITLLKESSASYTGDEAVTNSNEIVERYNALINIKMNILNLPIIKDKKDNPITFEIKNYNEDLKKAKEELSKNKEAAAQIHYQKGLELLKQNDIESNKKAAKEFKSSLSFVKDYKDANNQYEIAKKGAIKRIAIIPFENKSGKTQFGAIGEMMTDQIVSDLLKNKDATEFLEIITRDQLQKVIQEQNLSSSNLVNESSAIQIGKILGVNEILTGQITQIITSYPPTTSKNIKEEKEMWARNGNYKVFADVTLYRKEASAAINGSYKIIDVKTAKIQKSDSFKEDYQFLSEWGVFSGDKNALSNQSSTILSNSEMNPPVPEEIANIVANKLSNSLVITIINYVK